MPDAAQEALNPNTHAARLWELAVLGKEDTFNVYLQKKGAVSSSIYLIKTIRDFFNGTGITLQESVSLVERVPSLLNRPRLQGEIFAEHTPQQNVGLSESQAKGLAMVLRQYGASVALEERQLLHPLLSQLVAQNPASPAALLMLLAKSADPQTRRFVTQNPGTPKELLLELGKEHPDAFAKNPVLTLLLIEDPSLASLPSEILGALLRDPEAPEWLLLAALSSLEARRMAATRSDIAQKWLLRFAYDQEVTVRVEVARNLGAPRALLEKLSLDPEEKVRDEALSQLQARAD